MLAADVPPAPCDEAQGTSFVCGAVHPEDLARIPGTRWIVASGFDAGAGIKLVDTNARTLKRWYSGDTAQIEPDATRFPHCPSSPDAAAFNAQGMSLRAVSDHTSLLYVSNHGGREAIEVFRVDVAGEKEPALKWIGCVPLPVGMAANSVATFADGAILITVLTRPGTQIADFVQGRVTGLVYEWQPGTPAFEQVKGAELPGNNGLETSKDGKEFYVVAFGWRSVVTFTHSNPTRIVRKAVAPGFMPDNIHWDGDQLIAAGMQYDEPACGGTRKIIDGKADPLLCHRGYTVARLDPLAMTWKIVAYSEPNPAFSGASTGLVLGGELWVGSFQSDRIAIRRLPARSSGDSIATSSGEVAGTLLPSGVTAYLGIRYAAPPTQELRWKPPQPIHWQGVWVADRKGAECIQVLRPHGINHYFGEETTGEDCLYLNVWVPPDARPGAQRPVIVFIYGGGGTIGSSGMAVYGGENVARHGAIFVSMNYRVGALGFMAHPELSQEQGGHSGNYGYLDQNAALRWVRDNIAAFGGDPQKVVLTGQSFGAGSVAAHLFSPLSKGLFRAAAMWSACNFTSAGPDLATAEKVGVDLQNRLGVPNLEKMREVPADRILAQQAESQLGANVQGVRTPPLIDGYFAVGEKAALLESHAMTDVPILVGSNTDDLDASQSPLTRARTVPEFQAAAREMYGAAADEFLRLYPVNTDADVFAMAHAAARENGMLKASRTCAQAQAQYNQSPTYIELFAHKHSYAPGVVIADQNPATIGAYHTADVPFWFGTLDAFNSLRPTRAWTTEDRRLSEMMLRSLVAFAASGSPKVDGLDWVSGLDWPAWSTKREHYVVIDESPHSAVLESKRMNWLAAHPPVQFNAAPKPGPRD